MSLLRKGGSPAIRHVGERGMRLTLVGVVVNLGLALTKCTAGFLAHSLALVADGLESAADMPSRSEINRSLEAHYDAAALNNFARLSISAALASPITK